MIHIPPPTATRHHTTYHLLLTPYYSLPTTYHYLGTPVADLDRALLVHAFTSGIMSHATMLGLAAFVIGNLSRNRVLNVLVCPKYPINTYTNFTYVP